MKAKQILFAVVFSLIVIINSCAPAYVPNVINAPLLTNKGEVQVALNAGTSGFDPQVAYAISNHVGVMANASFQNNTSDSTDSFHKHSFVEFGTGYFTNFGTRGKFETFGGVGFGKLKAEYDNDLWASMSDVKCTRFFIQPTVGMTTKVFDMGLSSRLVVVKLSQESGGSNTGCFLEPAATIKVGYDHVKAVMQVGFSMPINESNVDFNYQPFLISLGIQGNFGKMFK